MHDYAYSKYETLCNSKKKYVPKHFASLTYLLMLCMKIKPCVTIKKMCLHTSCIFTQSTHTYCEYITFGKTKKNFFFPIIFCIYLIFSCMIMLTLKMKLCVIAKKKSVFDWERKGIDPFVFGVIFFHMA